MLGVGGAPSGFFFFGGALACSGLYSWRERESKRRLDRGHWGGTTSVFGVSGQTSKAGQFMCIPGPWLLLNHFRSSCVFAARIVRSSSLYIVA